MEGVMAREAPKEPGRSYAGDEGDESFCDARDASTPYMPSSTEPSPRPDDAVDQADDIPLARRVILQEETPQDVCSICIDEFTDDDPGMETTCKHHYHLQCIMQWAQRSRECPLCFKALQLKDPSMNELLPFGEYVPPPSATHAAPSESLTVGGLDGWQLERLLSRLALVHDGSRVGNGGSAASRHGRRAGIGSGAGAAGAPHRVSRSRTALTWGQAQSLRDRAARLQQQQQQQGSTLGTAGDGGAEPGQDSARGGGTGAGAAPTNGCRGAAGGGDAASASGSSAAAEGGGQGWSVPAGRDSPEFNGAAAASHIIIHAPRGLRSLSAREQQQQHSSSPSKSGLLARCKASFTKTAGELRRALTRSPTESGPSTPTNSMSMTATAVGGGDVAPAPPPAAAAAAVSG